MVTRVSCDLSAKYPIDVPRVRESDGRHDERADEQKPMGDRSCSGLLKCETVGNHIGVEAGEESDIAQEERRHRPEIGGVGVSSTQAVDGPPKREQNQSGDRRQRQQLRLLDFEITGGVRYFVCESFQLINHPG